MEEQDLEQRLAEYLAGDTNALGAIVDATRRPLYSVIHSMVRNPGEADDLFQDVWIRAVKNLANYEHRQNRFLPWLFRIARNRVIDLTRKKKPDVSLQQPLSSADGATIEDVLPNSLPSPSRTTGNSDLQNRIRAAVDRLPDDQREVFILRMEGNIPFKEIAELHGVSINTALGRMQYAVRKLREELQSDYQDLLNSRD